MKKRTFDEFVFSDADLSDFEAAVMFGRWFMECAGEDAELKRLVSVKYYSGRKFALIGRRGFVDSAKSPKFGE